MPEEGHFQRMQPLIKGLTARGLPVTVFTDRRFVDAVTRSGAVFEDLFATNSLQAADDESLPVPCRYVTFAGGYLDEFIARLVALDASLVIYDTFAVVAPLASRELGLPHVNVCSGHNVEPARFMQLLEVDPRVKLADRCLAAVDRLRTRFPDLDLSPFCYVSLLSPDLNVYCEPEAFLDAAARVPFEPLVFFGSLPSLPERRPDAARAVFRDSQEDVVRVYASFGTVIWRYYRDEASRALGVLSTAIRQRPKVRLLIGTGRSGLAGDELACENVRVEPYVDQLAVLDAADLFVTHHGLNSTHEAIAREVPMLSYPFFWDQPALAEKCQQLDLAVALGSGPRAPIDESDVFEAMDVVVHRLDRLRDGLKRAAQWEAEVIESRDLVFDRIESLA
jgi:UDP:flavonoid glycosyltransferase YjiC (YdhE family)